MNSFPYMPLYWNDMIADNKVRVMSNGELGVYIRLLAAAWHEAAPGTPPADEETLARLAGVRAAAWRRVRARVLACFSWNAGASRHEQKRMMQEYAALAERNDRRSDAGAKAAAARWKKAAQDAAGHISHASHSSHSAGGTEEKNAKNGNHEADAPVPANPGGMPSHAHRNASALRPECLSESNSDSPSDIDTPRASEPPAGGVSKCSEGCASSPPHSGMSEEKPPTSGEAREHHEDASDRHSSVTEAQPLATAMTAGVPPEFARMIYEDWCARGGRDGAGVLVPWARYLAKRWAREAPEWQAGTHRLQTKNRSPFNPSNYGNSAKDQPPEGKSEYDRDRDRTGIRSTAGETLRRL